ncbi:hypothetical protein ACB098_09G008600 [Castanea mollissima]
MTVCVHHPCPCLQIYLLIQVFGDFSCCDSLVEIHPSIDFSKFHGTETRRNVVDRWLWTWKLLRANSVKPIHSIRFKYRNNPQRERSKVVFPEFAYSHIRSSRSK